MRVTSTPSSTCVRTVYGSSPSRVSSARACTPWPRAPSSRARSCVWLSTPPTSGCQPWPTRPSARPLRRRSATRRLARGGARPLVQVLEPCQVRVERERQARLDRPGELALEDRLHRRRERPRIPYRHEPALGGRAHDL